MTINELKEKLNQWEKESPLGGETPICMKWLHRYDYDYDFDDFVRIDYDAPYRKVGISVEE